MSSALGAYTPVTPAGGDEKGFRFSVFHARANRRIMNDFLIQQERDRYYIEALEALLKEHDIEVPEEIVAKHAGECASGAARSDAPNRRFADGRTLGLMQDGSLEELRKSVMPIRELTKTHTVKVQFRDLTFWNMVPEVKIPTVGSTLAGLLMPLSAKKNRVDVLKQLTGSIAEKKMTLVMGPPGSGKSTFLKALSGKLHVGSAHLEGDIFYNGDSTKSGKYLLPNIADYIDEKDIHAATLTVMETMEFAWRVSTGGKHSHAMAKDEQSAQLLERNDASMVKLHNVLNVLGIAGVANTVVGDGMLRGVSGGQKRRVTVGEMMMPNRMIKYMDAISNGLDASTTYDIIRAFKFVTELMEFTTVISLLQPAPEVFNLFDELILFSEGQIIYQGSVQQVVPYFEGLGYKCPDTMDVADFLQELPTPEGRRFIVPGRKPVSTYNLPTLVASEPEGQRSSSTAAGKKELGLREAGDVYEDGDGEDRAGPGRGGQVEMGDIAPREDFASLRHGDRSTSSIVEIPDIGLEEDGLSHSNTSASGVAGVGGGTAPRGTTALVQAWKQSAQYKAMLDTMDSTVQAQGSGSGSSSEEGNNWPEVFRTPYAGSYWFSLQQIFAREVKVTVRDMNFIKGRIMQAMVVGAIAGSLFNDTDESDVQTLSGVLFFSCLNGALANMSLIPVAFGHRDVFYKHSAANFFPSSVYVICRNVVLYPLFIAENLIFSLIVYWSVGLSDDENGSRFLAFIVISLCMTLATSQLFTTLVAFMPSPVTTTPLAGVCTVLMVLFSGYILPKENIPDGALWLYYINPLAYALQAMMVNELTSSDYDFKTCTSFKFDPVVGALVCTKEVRFGTAALDNYGYETDRAWVWYGVIIMLGEYVLLAVISGLLLTFFRVESSPPAPIYVDDEAVEAAALAAEAAAEDLAKGGGSSSAESGGAGPSAAGSAEIPFEPVNFAFRDVWYTVTLKGGEELDLLRGVSGYFEPGTLTALMGSSGAGKTTLLDVLSGRKNTGVVKGDMMVNGKPKDENLFRHIMGYVEQFDTLSPHDTAREAIEFSAAMRLPRGTSREARADWVNSVIHMLELVPLEHSMVGSAEAGGMSFEQKKRVSIGVELAANPAILFLDEPTSGLDSRSAQVVIRCIRRVAQSGRSIVCTIHQPSSYIFAAFDSLLLLRRGGQTVFFGELGEQCQNLVSFFQQVPGVQPMAPRQNPASWMLDVIGAGTSGGQSGASTTDFHEHYKASTLCSANSRHVDALMAPSDGDDGEGEGEESAEQCALKAVFQSGGISLADISKYVRERQAAATHRFNATYVEQFRFLMYRFMLTYWRSPSYNFARMLINIVIALIFSSVYVDQSYDTDIDVISRTALIFVTSLFTGIVAMMTVQSVIFSERPAFYREKNSNLYDVKLYALAAMLVEVPYLVVSSVLFMIPFFFIVGFDKDGTASKFFWYWLFQGTNITTMVFLGHFFAALLPDEATAQAISGMASTVVSLFCGFMIQANDMPTFWQFLYWLDPLHYTLEGIFTTQFNRDHTKITLTDGTETTAQGFVEDYFSDWNYRHRVADFVALLIFIVVLRMATYLALEYVRHDKR